MTDENRNDDQYECLCDNCECVLAENVNVECLARGDEEQTWCMDCWDVLGEEMRAEGWVAQGDEDDVDEPETESDEECENCACRLGTVISEGKEALLLCQKCYEDEPNWAHTRSVRKDE